MNTNRCSSQCRSVLGFSIQYEYRGKFFTRPIGFKRLLSSHTGAYIAKTLKKALERFGVSIDNVYAISTDNGKNMIRAKEVIKLYQSHLLDDFLGGTLPFHEQEIAYNSFIEKELRKHVKELNDDRSGKFVQCIRCAAHTMQLGIEDGMKLCPNQQQLINKARELIKLLRSQNIFNVIVTRKLPKPKMDVATRWLSVHGMLKSLIALKDFCVELSLLNEKFAVDDGFWPQIIELTRTLKYTNDAMIKLQAKRLVLSDVFAIFTLLDLQLKQHPDDELASNLRLAINRRSDIVLRTKSMYACMYLDPRFQCMLVEAEKVMAKEYLASLHRRILVADELSERLNETVDLTLDNTLQSSNNTLEISSFHLEPIDLLEDMLREKCKGAQSHLPISKNLFCIIFIFSVNDPLTEYLFFSFEGNISSILNEFDYTGQKRMKSDENIFDFWRNNIDSRPELYNLAAVLLAIPPTEVGCEQNFSILKLVLTKLRNKLNDNSLERILFMKFNSDLFDKI